MNTTYWMAAILGVQALGNVAIGVTSRHRMIGGSAADEVRTRIVWLATVLTVTTVAAGFLTVVTASGSWSPLIVTLSLIFVAVEVAYMALYRKGRKLLPLRIASSVLEVAALGMIISLGYLWFVVALIAILSVGEFIALRLTYRVRSRKAVALP